MDWRPIETAPNNSDRLLLFFPGCPAEKVWTGYRINAGTDGEDWVASFGKASKEYGPPTHWMPLPSPPHKEQSACIPLAYVGES